MKIINFIKSLFSGNNNSVINGNIVSSNKNKDIININITGNICQYGGNLNCIPGSFNINGNITSFKTKQSIKYKNKIYTNDINTVVVNMIDKTVNINGVNV